MNRDAEEPSSTGVAASPTFGLLEDGLAALPLTVHARQVSLLAALAELVSRWGDRINLSGHRDAPAIATRLILDAATLAATLPELSEVESIADLGSGAGFPGFPVAILNPHLHVRLIEARSRRHHFQREVCRRLELGNVEPVRGRSDHLDPEPSDVVTAQAMAAPIEALRLMRAWAKPGGLLILPASDGAPVPDLSTDLSPRLAPVEVRSYEVPISRVRRQIFVTQRLSEDSP